MEISSKRNINKIEVYHQESTKFTKTTPPKSSRAQGTAHASHEIHSVKRIKESIKETILPTDNQKLLPIYYNDEKLAITLLIVGTELIVPFA